MKWLGRAQARVSHMTFSEGFFFFLRNKVLKYIAMASSTFGIRKLITIDKTH